MEASTLPLAFNRDPGFSQFLRSCMVCKFISEMKLGVSSYMLFFFLVISLVNNLFQHKDFYFSRLFYLCLFL